MCVRWGQQQWNRFPQSSPKPGWTSCHQPHKRGDKRWKQLELTIDRHFQWLLCSHLKWKQTISTHSGGRDTGSLKTIQKESRQEVFLFFFLSPPSLQSSGWLGKPWRSPSRPSATCSPWFCAPGSSSLSYGRWVSPYTHQNHCPHTHTHTHWQRNGHMSGPVDVHSYIIPHRQTNTSTYTQLYNTSWFFSFSFLLHKHTYWLRLFRVKVKK